MNKTEKCHRIIYLYEDDCIIYLFLTIVVGIDKEMYGADSPTSSTTTYGSLLRPNRMLPLLQSQKLKLGEDRGSLFMYPGEYIVHLKRQATGFGFNLIGGAEENTQVSKFKMYVGC